MKNERLALLIVFLAVLAGLVWSRHGTLLPPSSDETIWFHGGLFTLLLGTFWIRRKFSTPDDVVVNGLIVYVSTSTLQSPPYELWWDTLRWSALALTLIAVLVSWDRGWQARIQKGAIRSAAFSLIVRVGSARILFSIVFLLSLLSYFDLQSNETMVYVLVWTMFLLTAELNLASIISRAKNSWSRSPSIVGIVSRLNSPSIAHFTAISNVHFERGQVVGFIQSGGHAAHSYGLVVNRRISKNVLEYETHVLGGQRSLTALSSNTLVVKTNEDDVPKNQMAAVSRLIGITSRGTNISTLNFEVLDHSQLEEGTLLEVADTVEEKSVYFQVVAGTHETEASIEESKRVFTNGNAEQLGTWNSHLRGFETHSWVVAENSLVLRAAACDVSDTDGGDNKVSVGNVPLSSFPALVDMKDLVLHHSAILGVTGSGKSFLTYQVVEEAAARGTKVICIDPTGDYKRFLKKCIQIENSAHISAFLEQPDEMIAVIQPSSDHPKGHPINLTNFVARKCFEWCKENRTEDEIVEAKPKVLLVLEEAHLLVPEFFFNPDKQDQKTVSSTAQITLQARKYGLGFLVVTQRTANVVKSILNQCNTIFAFQAFDETGFDFLRNYMGRHYVASLPNLKSRHGILVGKASLSDRPLIVRFHDQERAPSSDVIPTFGPSNEDPDSEELTGPRVRDPSSS